jgi:EAL domain-containing protein (putative c-di-GMP-specific phosphodiesterase class I)
LLEEIDDETQNLSVVGEGIESRAQAAQLLALGCDRGQGFLFARPQSAEAITALLYKDADLKESAA